MNRRTLELMDAALAHWIENWKIAQIDEPVRAESRDQFEYQIGDDTLHIGCKSCPLCQQYGWDDDCQGCPVAVYTDRANCRNTPWYGIRDDLDICAIEASTPPTDDLRWHIARMVVLLREVREWVAEQIGADHLETEADRG